MNVLLIELTNVLTSTAPGKAFTSSVVCFKDSYYIFLHVPAYTFHVNSTPDYGFGDKTIAEGLKDLIAASSDENELRNKLQQLVPNNTLIVNFSDYKKAAVKSFLGVKTLKVSNSALDYVSFNGNKEVGKSIAAFYAHLG